MILNVWETTDLANKPHLFWKLPGTHARDPLLYQYFRKIATIPPTTANVEILHSFLKLIVGDRRHMISPQNLVKIAFIKMNSFAAEYYKMFSASSENNDLERASIERDQE